MIKQMLHTTRWGRMPDNEVAALSYRCQRGADAPHHLQSRFPKNRIEGWTRERERLCKIVKPTRSSHTLMRMACEKAKAGLELLCRCELDGHGARIRKQAEREEYEQDRNGRPRAHWFLL